MSNTYSNVLDANAEMLKKAEIMYEADQKAMNAFDENDAGSFHNLLHTFARGVDINGNPRGFVGAWKMAPSGFNRGLADSSRGCRRSGYWLS